MQDPPHLGKIVLGTAPSNEAILNPGSDTGADALLDADRTMLAPIVRNRSTAYPVYLLGALPAFAAAAGAFACDGGGDPADPVDPYNLTATLVDGLEAGASYQPRPIQAASVGLQIGGARFSATTDSQGRVSIRIPGDVLGSGTLSIEKDGVMEPVQKTINSKENA